MQAHLTRAHTGNVALAQIVPLGIQRPSHGALDQTGDIGRVMGGAVAHGSDPKCGQNSSKNAKRRVW
jgi:hypothetical protein